MKRKGQNDNLKRFIFSIIIVVILGVIPVYTISLVIINRYNESQAVINIEDRETIDLNIQENNNRSLKNDVLVVNKEISIDSRYTPDNLVVPNIVANKEIKVTRDVAESLQKLFDAAKKDGINLIAVSGYRSYSYQKSLFDESVRINGLDHAKKYVALPGYSEHHTGLAVDIVSDVYTVLDEGFESTDAFKWLEKNMSEYGFILRYPKGREDITGYNYEPWHIRYVGEYLAEDIKSAGITLEEYISE